MMIEDVMIQGLLPMVLVLVLTLIVQVLRPQNKLKDEEEILVAVKVAALSAVYD